MDQKSKNGGEKCFFFSPRPQLYDRMAQCLTLKQPRFIAETMGET